MDKLNFAEVFLFSVPEAIAITSIIFGLSGIKIKKLKIFYIGLITGLILYFIRPVISSYILNVIIYTSILILLIILFKLMDFFRAFISTILGISIYLIIEYINVTAIQYFFNIDPTIFLKNYYIRFLCFLPQLIFAFIISYLIRKLNLKLFIDD
ncbi:MAG: hypothetical protein ACPL3A_06355 [Thermoanaerobacteraceae bacterium]